VTQRRDSFDQQTCEGKQRAHLVGRKGPMSAVAGKRAPDPCRPEICDYSPASGFEYPRNLIGGSLRVHKFMQDCNAQDEVSAGIGQPGETDIRHNWFDSVEQALSAGQVSQAPEHLHGKVEAYHFAPCQPLRQGQSHVSAARSHVHNNFISAKVGQNALHHAGSDAA
jgi:hypothetical protein